MKAIVQERFGSPDVLQFVDADQPQIGPGDVLVRVHAAAVNPYDWHLMRGDPYVARLMGTVGLTRPKPRVAGVDGAGVVEAVGTGVRGLRPGDEVLGRFEGSFAEYARAEAHLVVAKPTRLTFGQAAAVTMAGQTALRAIRDVGRVQPGHRVLINGAAGGVGSYAVQIAAAMGAEVIDNVGNQPLRRLRRALTPSGTLVSNAGGPPGRHVFGPIGAILRVVAVDAVVRQRLRPLPDAWTREHLLAVTELVEAGQVTPVVGRTFPLADTAAAVRHLEEGHARGKVVITVR
jgi:NADPH:quinone reductase-like Zn-dependent oxidoreductase